MLSTARSAPVHPLSFAIITTLDASSTMTQLDSVSTSKASCNFQARIGCRDVVWVNGKISWTATYYVTTNNSWALDVGVAVHVGYGDEIVHIQPWTLHGAQSVDQLQFTSGNERSKEYCQSNSLNHCRWFLLLVCDWVCVALCNFRQAKDEREVARSFMFHNPYWVKQ